VASDDKPRILGCTERHPVARAITTRPKALVTLGFTEFVGRVDSNPRPGRDSETPHPRLHDHLQPTPPRFQGSGPARATAITTFRVRLMSRQPTSSSVPGAPSTAGSTPLLPVTWGLKPL